MPITIYGYPPLDDTDIGLIASETTLGARIRVIRELTGVGLRDGVVMHQTLVDNEILSAVGNPPSRSLYKL